MPNGEDFDSYRIFMLDKLSTHGAEIASIKSEIGDFRLETKLAIQEIKSKLTSIMAIGTIVLNALWQVATKLLGI